MSKFYWSVDFDNCNVEDNFSYEIEGWVLSESGRKVTVSVRTDADQELEYCVKRKNRVDLRNVLKTLEIPSDAGFTVSIEKIYKLRDLGCTFLELIADDGEEKQTIFHKEIQKILEEGGTTTLEGNLDIQEKKDDRMILWGWAYDKYDSAKIEVLDSKGQPVPFKMKREVRNDVNRLFHLDKERKCGYILSIRREDVKARKIIVRISNKMTAKEFPIDMKKFDRDNTTIGKYLKVLGPSRFAENRKRIRETGLKDFRYYAIKEMNRHISDYDIWLADHKLSEKDLKKQREHRFAYEPKISIVIPLYNTPLDFLKALIDSVQSQTYRNWQLCLADGSNNGQVGPFIQRMYGKEKRISYVLLEKNDGISENTNGAIRIADGDFIMFSDHDDTLAPNALYEIVKAVNEDLETDVVYTDEDKITMDGKTYYDPHFKPDFNLDLLRSNNYICHIFVVKKDIVDQVGLLRKEYDGAQDFDFILRCCEKAHKIKHIPKILYHWRNHPASTAGDPTSKMYAYEAGRAAVAAHFERIGMKAEVTMTDQFGRYRTKLLVEGEPLVSIMIPNKDHREDLEKCIHSIYEKSTYRNFEILIIENNSETEEIFSYYNELEQEHSNLRVLRWDKPFNYSAINNFGAEHARGEYLVLMNNDIEVKSESWMEEMLGYCQREDVGVVGAKLLFPDERIQHAGIIVGLGPSGTAGHIFYTFPNDVFTYVGKASSTQDLSAVTAACMMTKKSLYQEIGGMDESFVVAFNDVDYCLRVREQNKLVVYHAFVEMYHYESVTRGYEDKPENAKRFAQETKRFKKRWEKILKAGDPYYNPNLTKTRNDCVIRS